MLLERDRVVICKGWNIVGDEGDVSFRKNQLMTRLHSESDFNAYSSVLTKYFNIVTIRYYKKG